LHCGLYLIIDVQYTICSVCIALCAVSIYNSVRSPRSGSHDGAGPHTAGDRSVPRGGVQHLAQGHGLLRPRQEGRVRFHLRNSHAQTGARRSTSPGRIHGAQSLEDPHGLLPVSLLHHPPHTQIASNPNCIQHQLAQHLRYITGFGQLNC
jgi:hypothetical protein